VIKSLTDLNVGFLCGEMGVDFWSRDHWRNWLAQHECIVLTPQLLLDALRHGFVAVRLEQMWTVSDLVVVRLAPREGAGSQDFVVCGFYPHLRFSGRHTAPQHSCSWLRTA
jgi:hypothetical protein